MTTKYLLIGSGRVSSHFQHYFRLLGLDFTMWKRSDVDLAAIVHESTHVLFLISDTAIEKFIKQHEELFKSKILVHFSGALSTPLAESAHPLMTFAKGEVYELETYKNIPFVTESGRKNFAEILPGLANPHFTIDTDKKTLYHALCVMSGNFTTLLWQKAFHDFEEKLGLPKEILLPYMDQIVANLKNDLQAALTGPLARGDKSTIQKHLQTLGHDPFAGVYRAVVKAYNENKDEIGA